MISKRFKTLLGTMLAMILMMAFVSGCTITGKNNKEIKPLTDDELSYFNGDEFFNGDYLNIRNQFLSSIYESPEKIDVLQLFYCGSGIEEFPTEAEKKAIIAYNGWDTEPDCACTKISRSNMDAVLGKYMGLALSDTENKGLENFIYLEEYDAYYFYHGDTNYRAKIIFSGGEREGDTIRLFYDDVFFGDGEKVLTLKEKDGSYLFVSNVYSTKASTGDTHSESIFSLTIPETGTLFLDVYPVDFPFGLELTEKSRKGFRAESFGKGAVVEGEDLQVTYLNHYEGVYTITTIRTVKEGYSSAGAAIGSTEKAFLNIWPDKPLKKIESISYDDEAWFGDDYEYAYAYTPEESTKSLLFLIKDGLVSGIEIINGLDGAMY